MELRVLLWQPKEPQSLHPGNSPIGIFLPRMGIPQKSQRVQSRAPAFCTWPIVLASPCVVTPSPSLHTGSEVWPLSSTPPLESLLQWVGISDRPLQADSSLGLHAQPKGGGPRGDEGDTQGWRGAVPLPLMKIGNQLSRTRCPASRLWERGA